MHPAAVAPSLLFICPLVSLILIAFQLSSLHKSHWDTHSAQGTRRLLALFITLLVVFLSALSGTLGLVACHAWNTDDRSRAARAGVGGKVIMIILQSGLSMYMMFLLNLPALVEPIPAPSMGALTFSNIRTLTVVMSFPLIANTVISIVFAALQEDYPAARLPALCWLLFFIPLFCVTILLYLSIRRTREYPIIARLWLILAVGQACGVLSVICALVGKGDFQIPTSLFGTIWITCITFALHIVVDPPALLQIPLVPATSGHYARYSPLSPLQRRIFALFRTRLRHPHHHLQRSHSLCSRQHALNRRRRKVFQLYWPQLVTHHLQT
ncbi:hypothetical protein BJV78DRAFT_946723 [Lactifluus subvellereus]|nr:hypothetical protein BJV78DRAFT_946723 [Lactifluus subvellereus]